MPTLILQTSGNVWCHKDRYLLQKIFMYYMTNKWRQTCLVYLYKFELYCINYHFSYTWQPSCLASRHVYVRLCASLDVLHSAERTMYVFARERCAREWRQRLLVFFDNSIVNTNSNFNQDLSQNWGTSLLVKNGIGDGKMIFSLAAVTMICPTTPTLATATPFWLATAHIQNNHALPQTQFLTLNSELQIFTPNFLIPNVSTATDPNFKPNF